MTGDALSEQAYEEAADRTLRALTSSIVEMPEGPEADLANGILTIEFEDGAKYVINSHRAARQIWMAAERSAWHFDLHPEDGRWIAAKGGDELWSTVEAVLSRKLQRPVRLQR
jgi:CyaY protein